MNTTTNHNGSITVADIIDDYRVHRTYYDYEIGEAIALFKEEFYGNTREHNAQPAQEET